MDQITDTIKLPPHSIDAEQSILGGLLINNESWDNIASIVNEDDFYRRDHRLIFKAICDQIEEGKPCDVVTLSERMESHNNLDEVGGLAYLGSLVNNTPSATNIRAYSDIVRERSVLRKLITIGNEIADSAFNTEGRKSDDILEAAEKTVFEIADKGANAGNDFKGMTELLKKNVDRIDELYQNGGSFTGIPTGFNDFDKQTSGLQPADLVIVAGRPSMGKCLAADSEVVLQDGSIETIKSLYQKQEANLLTLDNDWKIKPAQASAFIDDGKKPVFKITTRLGKVVQSTANHPFLTPSGWQPISELSLKTRIAVPKIIPVFGTQALQTSAVIALANSLHRFSMEAQNGDSQNSDTKVIPKAIFCLPKEQLLLFLSQLFSKQSQLAYRSVSETIIRQLQHLLLRFAIVAEIIQPVFNKQEINEQEIPVWQLNISDYDAIKQFADQFMSKDTLFNKHKLKQKIPGLLQKASAKVKQNTMPMEFWRDIKRIKGDESWSALGYRAGLELHEGQALLEQTQLAQLADVLDDQWLKQLANSDVYWDEIISIEALGVKQVYDLTIAETHNFIANDLCVHNTTFAMNLAENAAIGAGVGVAVFSMEMPADSLTMRMLSSLGRINQTKVRSGQLDEEDWPRLTSAVSILSEANIFIDDTPALSPTEMRARVRRLKRKHNIGLIVVDYLQLMQVKGSSENRVNEISEISRGLKALAKEMNVPVIALSQLNRGLEQRPNKRPVMSDLRESGAIEQDADLIVFIYRDEVYNEDSPDKGTAEIIISKQRNGPLGVSRLTFLGQYTRFENHTSIDYND